MENFEAPEVVMTDTERILQLELAQYQSIEHLNRFVSQPATHVPPPPTPPPPPIVIPPQPNLNIPTPPSFSRLATELPEFKMKMFQLLNGNPHTYTTSRTQLLYAGHNLIGMQNSPLQSRERALRSLRQTGSIFELAIAFQTIVHTFSPLWGDHPLIYTFPDKLKEHIRFELTAQGSLPTTL